MSQVEAQIQYYENTLTSVELELLQNPQHDRFEHDPLRDRLPPERWAEGDALFHELNEKHYLLLHRRRRALEKLSEGASHTLVQVTRRLGILDLEYGFIRTTIFWVRDQEPIGLVTLTQAARECSVLVKGFLRLVQDALKPALWGQPSGEFMAVAMAVLIVPVAIMRLRRVLGTYIKRGLPAPQA
jgi:potassium efflux system protein